MSSRAAKRTVTELTALLLSAARTGTTRSNLVKAMKLSSRSVDKHISQAMRRGMLLEKNGFLVVSSKGEHFLSEFRKLQEYKAEYQRRLKLLRDMLPSFKSKGKAKA